MFAIKVLHLLHLCNLKTQLQNIFQGKANSFKRDLNSLVYSLRRFLNALGEASKVSHYPLTKTLLAHIFNAVLEYPNGVRLPSDFKTTSLPLFLSKSLSSHLHMLTRSHLQKTSTTTNRKITTLARADIALRTSVKGFRAFTMCNAISPKCRYDNIFLNLTGNK